MHIKCKYTRTYTGYCEQMAQKHFDCCYYHGKVVVGLIEPDPLLASRGKTS